jgi:hypothetical protein
LAAAEELAAPKSVDAPVLDADCAYAGVDSAYSPIPVAKIADMAASNVTFLFIMMRAHKYVY